jgi:hypothetical protein
MHEVAAPARFIPSERAASEQEFPEKPAEAGASGFKAKNRPENSAPSPTEGEGT